MGEKYIFGFISSDNKEHPIGKCMEFNTLYNTLLDLDWKIKLSFQEAINYTYSDNVYNNFNLFNINSAEEKLSYYFIENALFRTSSLWDMLAQLYCLYYSAKVETDKIQALRIFNPIDKKDPYKKIFKNESIRLQFKESIKEINKYINQEDKTDSLDGEWSGNFKFVNTLRNKMIHRNSPNVPAMSNYDLNFKVHPAFMLKRIVEDYFTVSKFIDKILNDIEHKYFLTNL